MEDHRVQTVLFPKSKFSVATAIEWLKKHNYKHKDVDMGDHYLRFRQHQPVPGTRYITKTLPNGVEIVIGYIRQRV